MSNPHSKKISNTQKSNFRRLPAASLLVLLFGSHGAFAQNAVVLDGPTTTFGGQKNGMLIQGQTTLTNVVIQGPDSKAVVKTAAVANELQGVNIKAFQSDASTLGGMQVNNGAVNSTAEFIKSSNTAGYATRISQLESTNIAAGNTVAFGSTATQSSSGTFLLQQQKNSGGIIANTLANLDVSGSSTNRSAVLSTVATANSAAVINAFSANGAKQINAAGADVNATTTVNQMSSGVNSGSFTKLNVTTQATANDLKNGNVSVAIMHGGISDGVQNNAGNVKAASNINTNTDPNTFTTMNVRGSSEVLIATDAKGNSMLNSGVQTWNNMGSTTTGMQSNSGAIEATTKVVNFTTDNNPLNVTTTASGNTIINVNTVNFQQGAGLGLPLNGTILQENRGNVSATTELVNTDLRGNVDLRTQAVGNSALSLWDSGKSLNQYSMGSQINSGNVFALTKWTTDPTGIVNVTTTATGNSMVLAPMPTTK